MKAKFINEKYAEISDPIEDMGIGECERKLTKLEDKLIEFHDIYYERIIDNEHDNQAWEVLDMIQELRDITGYNK